MIISMRPHATREEIDHVCERIREFGYKVHSIEGEERVVIGVVGVGDVTACLESLEATPGVESAVRISAPYKFVSREFKKERSAIKVNGVEIGGDEFVVMAGPCSVESEKQIMETAEAVAAAGARMLRGGAFKPRTSPYDFQGLELEGLKLLRKAKEATGLAIVTEVMSDRDVGPGGRVRRLHAGGRAQHAELRAAEIAGRLRPAGAAEARHELHHQGAADVRRIHRGARQPQRDPVRARHPHLRDRHAQHLRHRRRPGAERADAPAGDPRSQPRHRQAQPGAGRVARRRRHRRRRPDRGSASLSRESRQRRRAVAHHRGLPRHDAQPRALHPPVEGPRPERA